MAALAVLVAGCGTASPGAGGVDEIRRLAALPHVPPLAQVPRFPPELQGLTFRVVALVDGVAPGAATSARAEACAASCEEWLSDAGWTPLRDPNAPVDLVIEEHCTPGVPTSLLGNLLEMGHAVTQTVAMVVEHDGAVVSTVPRGAADYVCESSGTPRQISTDCMARAERWAQAQIIGALIASEPLAQLARQLRPR